MIQTSARLLQLLSLLQVRREWTGPALAERMQVTERTVRRDIGKLRSLGYPIHASPGVAGGYQLGSGAQLPPLLLDDNEALAVALGLSSVAAGPVAGIGEASVRALAKLEQVLPSRLRTRFASLRNAVTTLASDAAPVDPLQLTVGFHRHCRPPAAEFRLHQGRRRRGPSSGGALPPGGHGAPLVPGRLGLRAGGLAHVPG